MLTPAIAITTAMIAVWQWRLERQKWKLALYDKRFETFRAVTEFLSLLCIKCPCEHKDEIEFLQKASRNRFLFHSDIQEYIELIYKKSVERNHLEKTIENSRGEKMTDYRGTLAAQSAEISHWFSDQFNAAEAKFAKYIAIKAY